MPDDRLSIYRPGRWHVVNVWNHDEIPRVPGVYTFSRHGRVVYVGQSTNLHDRFSSYCAFRPRHPRDYDISYFDQSLRLPNRMVGLTVKISVSKRYGDWLMRELRLISRLQPEQNTIGRRRGRTCA